MALATMLGKFSLGMFLLVLMGMLYVMADWIYGPYAEMVRTTLVVYLVLFALFMSALREGMPLMNASIFELSSFTIGFLITAAVLVFIPVGISGEVNYDTVKLAVGFGLLHGFIKAYIEESIFRGMLRRKVGLVWSCALFGMFHIGMVVLSLNSMGLAVTLEAVALPVTLLTAMAFVWSFMADRLGLMGAVGSHLAWNLKAFGVLNRVLGVA